MKRLLALMCVMMAACCCEDDNNSRCEDIENIEARSQCIMQRNDTQPTPLPVPVPKFYTIEYRVLGTARLAYIVYTSSIHGSTELTTGLPWFASFRTDKDKVFVSLYARAENAGTVRVQVLVNGEIFREASTDGFFGSAVEVSGTLLNPEILTINKQR
jgi:hypothetical protein